MKPGVLPNSWVAAWTSLNIHNITPERTMSALSRQLAETLVPATCGAQKQHSSLSSLLREPIFVMQAAEHGSLYNPVPRQATGVGARWAARAPRWAQA
jgi:hypothetical protein